jgi:hypothetical protein
MHRMQPQEARQRTTRDEFATGPRAHLAHTLHQQGCAWHISSSIYHANSQWQPQACVRVQQVTKHRRTAQGTQPLTAEMLPNNQKRSGIVHQQAWVQRAQEYSQSTTKATIAIGNAVTFVGPKQSASKPGHHPPPSADQRSYIHIQSKVTFRRAVHLSRSMSRSLDSRDCDTTSAAGMYVGSSAKRTPRLL